MRPMHASSYIDNGETAEKSHSAPGGPGVASSGRSGGAMTAGALADVRSRSSNEDHRRTQRVTGHARAE
jgi:hypothetical protein